MEALIYSYINQSVKEEEEEEDRALVYTPIIVIRLSNICLDSILTNQQTLNQIRVQVTFHQCVLEHIISVLLGCFLFKLKNNLTAVCKCGSKVGWSSICSNAPQASNRIH